MLEDSLQWLNEYLADIVPASEHMEDAEAAAEFVKVHEIRKRLKEMVKEIGRVHEKFTRSFWTRLVGAGVDKFKIPGYSLSLSAKGYFSIPAKSKPHKRAACVRTLMENPEWGINVLPGEEIDKERLALFCEGLLSEGKNPPSGISQHIIPRVQVRRVK